MCEDNLYDFSVLLKILIDDINVNKVIYIHII